MGQKYLDATEHIMADVYFEGVHSYEVFKNAVPNDARVVKVIQFTEISTGRPGTIRFILESAEWPPCDPEWDVPELKTIVKTPEGAEK